MYSTRDFYTIAVIILRQHEIKDIEEDQGRKTVFVEDTIDLRQDLLDYTNDQLLVSAKAFKSAIEDAKDLVHR